MKTAYHIFTVLLFLLLGVSCQKEEVRLPSNESPTEGEGNTRLIPSPSQ